MIENHKKLLLMRHGTAESMNYMSDDRSRTLTPEGKNEAYSVGSQIRSSALRPGHIYASDATRVRQTLEQITKAFEADTKLDWCPDFYCCNPQQVIDQVIGTSEKTETLMLIGHNPTWSELVLHLSGTIIDLSPAYCALLTHSSESWAEALSQNNWTLSKVYQPVHI